jgi:hypothetical protein
MNTSSIEKTSNTTVSFIDVKNRRSDLHDGLIAG